MSNPLLEFTDLPPFSAILPEHVEPAVDHLLAGNRAALERILAPETPRTWAGVVQPVEEMDERLDRVWAPVGHLNAVRNNAELRAAHNACLPKLSDYNSELGQNRALYDAWRAVAEGDEPLDDTQKRLLDQSLRDFRLSGVDLEEPARTRFREIQLELSELESRFEDNVLDATQAWSLQVTDDARLDGIPEQARDAMRKAATDRDLDGFVLTLDFPVYHAVATYATDRALRETMYEAWVTRAAPVGPHDAKYDNSETMRSILTLRREGAQLLGFEHFSALSLATKMAPDVGAVVEFLNNLVERSRETGRAEVATLAEHGSKLGLDTLQPWDVAFVAEHLRQERYAISDEDLRPYFPAPHVVAGMFKVVERLYGIQVRECGNGAPHRDPPESWHPDVTYYEIWSGDELRGSFWLDLYTRKGKRGGAWMGECRSRSRHGDSVDTPVTWLVCNFAPPSSERPSLLSHDEVTTLFHEFGHGLHHMLTRVDQPSLAGTNGVEWDAVELPSQFMESWCWEREALALISSHWQTGEQLPDELFDKLLAARHYLAAMDMLRQLEFALFDFGLHMDPQPDDLTVVERHLAQVREQVTVVPYAAYNSYPHSFSHIFGGGYAAGYYSYKWAEVLAADAFSLFQERGVFDGETGRRFLSAILERGGVRDAMTGFVEFRGREPRIDALLALYGMAA
ncbi:MAG: M3 family metallopeptidase [Xanthomonadaceae bacterium]|nr:M3 family metallopeptidase [Xanthomonadaceae bacterium]